MCGLWASIGMSPPRAVIDAVAHRGPDGAGWQEFATPAGPLVLAARRLAVFDRSRAGAQPLAYADGAIWLVFNGAIYNHVELRTELARSGVRFRSRSDTEVLAAAYEAWGPDCLARLNGMFAFVLWDRRAGRLFVARDRFAIKPLYWWCGDGGIAFASEIKQFAALPGFSARLEPRAADHFLAYGLFDHDAGTFYDGVQQLRGGECAEIDLAAFTTPATLAVRRWYEMPATEPSAETTGALAERLRALLADAVRLRQRADVGLGYSLSGGIDSTAILCLATAADPAPQAISACFDDPAIDERQFIDPAVARTNANSIRVFPRGDALGATLERVLDHQEGPLTSTSVIAQWAVFEAARAHGLTVMLDGQGADEQFGGYHAAFLPFLKGLLRRGQLLRLARERAAIRRRHGAGAAPLSAVLGGALVPGRFRPDRAARWLTRPVRTEAHRFADLDTMCRAWMTDASLPMLLHYLDRNAMAHGIEARLPFLDHRVVALAIALGDACKIVDGETKWILRRALDADLPPVIRDRPDKRGFATPEAAWLLGPLRPLVGHGIEAAVARFPDLFDGAMLRRYWAGACAGHHAPDGALWRSACFGLWVERAGMAA